MQTRLSATILTLSTAVPHSPSTHISLCGLNGMEAGVDAARVEIAEAHGIGRSRLKPAMRGEGRYHVETC
jgi:benzoyl-CoA 2,3-dioxygenase component A